MPKFYLRMEGVNFDNFVYDTNDLSTIRGGGLILLYAVNKVKEAFPHDKKPCLTPVSTGASSGLFSFDAADEVEAEEMRLKVESLLRTGNERHATFVVDVVAGNDDGRDFIKAKETLMAMNRLRQMRSPSFAIPGASGNKVCEFNRLLPASETITKGKGEKREVRQASESVKVRHSFGNDKKQKFFKDVTGIDIGNKHVYDLDQLTNWPDKGNLHHKMAVIYIDGNHFGKLEKRCDTPKKLENWDKSLKEMRRNALTTLVNEIIASKDNAVKGLAWLTEDRLIRFETLLWGGDDLLWIVPAWKGWHVLETFFNEKWTYEGKPLTHAAGLVFCHHNAPIHRITKLAKNLAELAKGADRDKNLVAYQALESFDHAGKDMDDLVDLRNARCPDNIDPKGLIIQGDVLGRAAGHMSALKAGFPKRQLHRIINAMPDGPEGVSMILKKIQLDGTANDTVEDIEQRLKECFGNAHWLHAADLWDYVGQEVNDDKC